MTKYIATPEASCGYFTKGKDYVCSDVIEDGDVGARGRLIYLVEDDYGDAWVAAREFNCVHLSSDALTAYFDADTLEDLPKPHTYPGWIIREVPEEDE